jgi:hypothetical protein
MSADQSADNAPEITPKDSSIDAPEGESSASFPALTAERMFDIALGAIAIAAEATGKRVQELGDQARTLRDDAPEILETWEERGRPLREQLLGKLREGFAPIADDEPLTAPVADPAAAPESPSAPTPPAASPSVGTRVREISALEQRVRELEAQVAAPVTPGSAPETALVVSESAMTPAEAATFDPELGSDEPVMALSDSPYAVSENEEEAAREESEKSPFAD